MPIWLGPKPRGSIALGTLGTGGGLPAGFGASSLYHDFTRQRYVGAPAPSISRASAKTVFNNAGLLSSVASGALALSDRGLSIEESRTSSVPNSLMAGTIGLDKPNGWNGSLAGSGITGTIVATGVEDGIPYLDYWVRGTSSASVASVMYFGPTSLDQITGLTGGVSPLTSTVNARLVGGSFGAETVDLSIRENNSGGGLNLQTLVSLKTATGASLSSQRFRNTVSPVQATTTGAATGIRLGMAIGTTVDFTIRIGLPKFEVGAFATSPDLSAAAPVVRAADVITIPNPTNYVSLAQGGAFIEFTDDLGPTGLGRRLFVFGPDEANCIRVFIETNNRVVVQVRSGNVSQANLSPPNSVVAGQTYKIAARWGLNDAAAFMSPSLGADPTPDTVVAVPTGSPAFVLGSVGGIGFINSPIKRLALWQTGPSNAELQALVA